MAAATLSESMPAAIGITARRSADVSQRGDSPWPSEPSTSASRSTPGAPPPRSATASSARVERDGREPGRRSAGRASYQSSSRVHGTVKTAPIADLDRPPVERVGAAGREQHGVDAERGAAAEDRADVGVVDDVLEDQHGPRAGRAPRRRRAAAASSEASAPRCTWKPVTSSASASDTT